MPQIGSGNEDIIKSWRYCATLQRRTPLAILREHGREVPAGPDEPPTLSSMMWHGIWTPVVDWGDLDEIFAGGSMASDVGPVPTDGGDYLPFLISLRTITEGPGTVASKEAVLLDLVKHIGPGGTPYSKFAKARELVDEVLPRAIHALPVPKPVREDMIRQGWKTLAKVERLSDHELLALKGIGPKSLVAIREFLGTTKIDKSAERALDPQFEPLNAEQSA
ncbi:helix-hairpin-helix domain-containing protein [Stenotrophomonas pigmentata]|uniref:hypothetical protein n=1 Tax=Stenotrophomonas pigmentata TaxID=3055080 RepID=UPI0026EA3C71|nr:hypothetical protein [Stenotrophomonas sp. 610A2]